MTDERLPSEFRIVHDLARVVARGPYDVGDILERISTELRDAVGFDRVLLARYRPEDRTVFAPVRLGVDWPGEEWLMLDKFPFLVDALESGRAVFVRDARATAALPSTLIERFGVESIVAVPLMVEGECLGFIVGDRSGGGFTLSHDELALLTTVGAVAAVFIAKAEQYETLRRMLDEREKLDRLKSDFISIASHELKTPISVVRGIASTLQDRWDELSEEQSADLRRALHETTQRLTELTDQLLDLSRIDAGVIEVTPTTFNARERIESIVASVAPERVADVKVEVPPSLELTCDTHAFERIVCNLIVNAFAYGRPPVIVGADADGRLAITVEDRGRGVDPGFEQQLFERFSRSPNSRDTKPPGAGLGLSIARSFARSLGGDLTYERAEPTGARFTLVLPT